jgi:hypothetical protein
VATTPSSIDGSTLTETQDHSPKFQTCQAAITLTQEGGATISTNANKIERFSLNYANQLSNDESVVGSFYLQDVTLLQRTVTADMDFVVRDAELYKAVYLNGGAVGSAWNPQIYRGTLTLTLNSSVNIASTTQPYQLVLNFPGLDFMMLPINLSGADLVRATLSTQVTLGPSGSDRFSATLISDVASY